MARILNNFLNVACNSLANVSNFVSVAHNQANPALAMGC